jgi:hypothetical protein
MFVDGVFEWHSASDILFPLFPFSLSVVPTTQFSIHTQHLVPSILSPHGLWIGRSLSLCSSRYWAAKAPPFKVELRLNPSQSKAATDTGSSRNTTTPLAESYNFRETTFQRRNCSDQSTAKNPWQMIQKNEYHCPAPSE